MAVNVRWDADDYVTQCLRRSIFDGMQAKERKLQEDFPGIRSSVRTLTRPTTIVDKFGRILMWCLPDLLPLRLQVMIQFITLAI